MRGGTAPRPPVHSGPRLSPPRASNTESAIWIGRGQCVETYGDMEPCCPQKCDLLSHIRAIPCPF